MHYDPRLIDLTRSFARDVAGVEDALPESIMEILLARLGRQLDGFKPSEQETDSPNVTPLMELRCAHWFSEYLSVLERFHEGRQSELAFDALGLRPDHPDFQRWCERPMTEAIFLRRFVRYAVCVTLKKDVLATAIGLAAVLYDVTSGAVVDELTNHRLSASSRKKARTDDVSSAAAADLTNRRVAVSPPERMKDNVEQLNTPMQRARDRVLERFPYLLDPEKAANATLRGEVVSWGPFSEESPQALLMASVVNRIGQLTPCWTCGHPGATVDAPLNHRFFDDPQGCGQIIHTDGSYALSPYTPAAGRDARHWTQITLNEARRHALLCGECGGLPQLWKEYQDRRPPLGALTVSRPRLTSPVAAAWLMKRRLNLVQPPAKQRAK